MRLARAPFAFLIIVVSVGRVCRGESNHRNRIFRRGLIVKGKPFNPDVIRLQE